MNIFEKFFAWLKSLFASKPVEPQPSPAPIPMQPPPPAPIPVITEPSGFTRAGFLEKSIKEASLRLFGVAAQKKYAAFFNKWFGQDFGVNGQRIPWCAAWVTYMLRQAGIDMDSAPRPRVKGFEQYCWALVETYQQWAIQKGWYIDNNPTNEPLPGDILIFDWNQIDVNEPDVRWQDHIGIFSKKNGQYWECVEGNTGDACDPKKLRVKTNVKGWIRIPDGTKQA